MSQQALRKWGIGVIGAAINAGVGAIALVVVDPLDFDPFGGGLMRLGKVSIALAIAGAGLYLRQHPIPLEDE